MFDILFTALYTGILFLILMKSIKHYFDTSSHFEDYYITVSMLCIFIEYLIYFVAVIINKYDFHFAIMTHFLETFAYWFMLIFLVKQVRIKKRSTARAINLFLIMFQILTFSCWGLFYNNPNMLFYFDEKSFMRMGVIGVQGFDIFIESTQLLMIIVSLIVCHRLRNNYMTLTVSFMIANELCHFHNIIYFKNMNFPLFIVEQIFNGLSALGLYYTIYLFYEDRNAFFKNKIREKII